MYRKDYLEAKRRGETLNNIPKYENKFYIGIEIECGSWMNAELVRVNAKKYSKLRKKIIIGRDGSIRNFPEGYEIRLLTTTNSYKKDLLLMSKLLKDMDAKVNDTCGLHVHIDCNGLSRSNLIYKFNRLKPILKSMAKHHRINNGYCSFNREPTGYHNSWIDRSDHGTLEVRFHEGTINMKDVERFITLLLSIVNLKKINKTVRSITSAKKILNLTDETYSYIKNRINLNQEENPYYV